MAERSINLLPAEWRKSRWRWLRRLAQRWIHEFREARDEIALQMRRGFQTFGHWSHRWFGKVLIKNWQKGDVLGIEIDEDGVRVCHFRRRQNSGEVVALYEASFPVGAVISGSDPLQKIVHPALLEARRHITESGLKLADAKIVTGLGRSDLLTKRIMIPVMPDEELDRQISFLAESHVPFDRHEIVVGWQPAPESVDHRFPGSRSIFISAAKTASVRRVRELFREAGFPLDAIEPYGLTLGRLLKAAGGGQPGSQAIFYGGARHSALAIIGNGAVELFHGFVAGSYDFVDDLQRDCQISWEEARIRFFTHLASQDGQDLTGKADLEKAIKGTAWRMINEVNRFLDFYRKTHGREISRLALAGQIADCRELLKFFETESRVGRVERLLLPPQLTEVPAGKTSRFALAIGLAMRADWQTAGWVSQASGHSSLTEEDPALSMVH
ncbi:pilus assembly protein PilM [Candidatus Uhrbacteria bacterium]|nr:pilus assembly protein PilM [Candidatus Uhrbacteria bacterium]